MRRGIYCEKYVPVLFAPIVDEFGTVIALINIENTKFSMLSDYSFNIFKRFYRLNKVIHKGHRNHSWSEFMKFEKMKINLDKKTYFMADGELLETSKEFRFSVIPKALNFIS